MSSTLKHVSLRIPLWIYEQLTKEARAMDRSVHWLMVKRLTADRDPKFALVDREPYLSGPSIEMNGYQRRTMGHALNCTCLICKPPKAGRDVK